MYEIGLRRNFSATGTGERMRHKRILIANLAVAASMAVAGCAGPMAKNNDQANVPPRDNLAPMGYQDAPPAGYAGQWNPQSAPVNSGYPDVQNPFTADLSQLNPQQSLERDLNFLRESERAQEQALREMRANPEIRPEAVHRNEQRLEETRQKMQIYDIALQQQRAPRSSAGGYAGGGRTGDLVELEDMMSRDGMQAMGAPKGFDFPPRTEVRLPVARPAPVQARPQPVESFDGGDAGDTQERVVYDPRRDGDFGLFSLQSGMGMVAPDGAADGVQGEEATERQVIIPSGSIPPSQKYVPKVTAQKPFAGAPVGRANFQPKQNLKVPDDWTPPPDLFSRSAAPEEVQSRPGLFSANETQEESSWPMESAPVKKTVIVSRPEPVAAAPKPLRPEAPALKPESALERPRVEIPAAPVRREAKPEVKVIRIETEPERPAARTERRDEPVKPALSDEVFVPDLFFSGR